MILKPAAARWELHRRYDTEAGARLARDLGAPEVIGQVLVNRGVLDVAAARRFLDPRLEDLSDPFLMLDMDRAVARIHQAAARSERVLVHGDYDVDGVTATFLMVSALQDLGVDVHHHIPHRTREGYGLSVTAVEAAARGGVRLIVTVDCGITAYAPIARARALGVDVVVSDHHEPGPERPDAEAVVNPHQPRCPYPFKALCGVGVAFQVARALARETDGRAAVERFLDVVALGTIADAVPLVGENRVITRAGLERLSRTENLGLRALVEVSGLTGKRISGGQVAFLLAPRINAAGRMGSAAQALGLLMARDPEEARACAQSLDEDNLRRRALDETVEREATERVERELGWPDCASIMLWSERWHPGVLGIVASRLVERFQRPAILASVQGEWARGSGRSVAGLDLTQVLAGCHDLLEAYGGHAYAAGLTAARGNLEAVRERVESLARARLDLASCVPRLTLDADLPFAACDLGLIEWLEKLPPHGLENPEPTFRVEDARIDSWSRVGNGKHLRLWLRDDSGVAEGIGFGLGERTLDVAPGGPSSVAYVPQRNEWMGETRIQLKVKALRRP
jgi:single-stranded-DNA-specific exonuclease